MSGNAHGGWDCDPNELNSQEAMFSMHNRHEQNPMSDGNHDMYGNHQQTLVSRSQRRHQQQQSAVLNPNNTVPIWQSQSGFGQSLFQRLGASMMFSSSSRGYRNIFSSATTQRSRPMILLIGDSRALGTFSGFMTENMRSGTSTERVSGGPEITELPNTPEEAEKSIPEFDATTQKIKVKGHKNKLPLTTKKMSFCENENDENEPCYHSGTNVDISNSPAFSNNELSLDVESITAELKEKKCLSCHEKVYDVSTDKSINVSDTTKLPSHIHSETKIQGTDFFKAEVADTKEHDTKRKTQAGSNVNGVLGPSEKYNKEVKTKAAEEDTSQPHLKCSKDNGKSKEKPKKNKKADTANYVRKTSNKLSVNFNLGHIDKSDHTPSEALQKDKDIGHEENKHFKIKPQVVGRNSTPLLDNIIDNGNNLSADVVLQYQEESEESKCSNRNNDFHSEASTALRESPGSKKTIKMKTHLVQDNDDKLTQKIDSSEDELLEERLFPQDSSPVDKSNWRSGFGDARLHADSDHIGHSNDLHEEQDMQQPPGHTDTGFPNDDNWYDNDSLFQSGTSDHNASLWQQDEYGKEEGKSCRYLEMVSNLRKLVSKEGLIVKDVYPDGNCLFAAVVDQLRVRGEFFYTPRTLRKAAVEHLRKYSVMPDGTPLYCFVTDASWEAYLSRMATEGEWGDHLIISAITNVLQRKLVILGGLSGLSRTVQEPDHAYKEITREWNQFNNNIPGDQHVPCSDGQKESVENKQSGSAEPECRAMKPETNIEEDLESLYLGHLAESHYVSLRRQDWEEKLHEVLGRKATSSVLIDSKPTEDTGLSAHHLSFLMAFVVRNAALSTPLTDMPCGDVNKLRHQLKLVGLAALGLDSHLVPIPSLFSEIHDPSYAAESKIKLNLDVLDIPNDTKIVKDGKDGNDVDLILHDDECFPGYTRLVPVNPTKWGRFVTQEDGVTCLTHIRCKDRLFNIGPVNMQKFLAFKCKWPDAAEEWKFRNRPFNWPRKQIIDIIIRNGCHFISPTDQTQETLWKYSFACSEKTLITCAMSDSMKSDFTLFKVLLEYVCKDCNLNIHLLMSVLFHCCENSRVTDWTCQPNESVLRLLGKLREFLESDFFPNYFVPTWNVLDCVKMNAPVEWYLSKITLLERELFVPVYFMLDEKNQTRKLGNTIDYIIEDERKFREHKSIELSYEDCFSPLSVKEIQTLIHLNCYEEASVLVRDVFRDLRVLIADKKDCYSYTHFLTNILTSIGLMKRWCFALYLDYMNNSNLVKDSFGTMQTVPLATILGPELNEELNECSVETDIQIPQALTEPLAVLRFVNYFSSCVLYELELEELYAPVLHFFLKTHSNRLQDSAMVYFDSNQPFHAQRILTTLSLLYIRVYTVYVNKNDVFAFVELLEGYDKVLDLLNIPESLQWMAELWYYFGNMQRANYCEKKAQMLARRR